MRMMLALAAFLLGASAGAAQIPGQTPDWPCAQRLVTTLEPGAYWNGPVPRHSDWRDDETLFSLVSSIVNRDTPDDEAASQLKTYLATIPPAQREAAKPRIFSAIVDETNDERSILIQRIEQLGRRQRNMGDIIAQLSSKLDALPESSPQHPDLLGTRDFDIRVFQEAQHSIRYACEAPANMERRLGVFARLLQAR
jgi:hypothetical protein